MNDIAGGTFLPEGKEPVIERVFRLVDRYPSKSAAARAWGMNISTLLNYYKRYDTQPTPRRAQLLRIAEVEKVSLNWLLNGDNEQHEPITSNESNNESINESKKASQGKNRQVKQPDITANLLSLLDFLSESEKAQLMAMFARKGIETVLLLLDEDVLKIAQAHPTVKKTAVLLTELPDVKVKEILAEIEGSERAQPESLTRKAG